MSWYEYRYRYTKSKVHTGGLAYMHLKDCIADAKRHLEWDKKVIGGVIEIWELDDWRVPKTASFVRYITRSDLIPKKKTKKVSSPFGL